MRKMISREWTNPVSKFRTEKSIILRKKPSYSYIWNFIYRCIFFTFFNIC